MLKYIYSWTIYFKNEIKITRKRDVGASLMISSLFIVYLIVFYGLLVRNNTKMFNFSAILSLVTPILFLVRSQYQQIYSEAVLKKIESFIIIYNSFNVGIFLLTRTMYGECGVVSLIDSWHCNPDFNSNSLPHDTGKFHSI